MPSTPMPRIAIAGGTRFTPASSSAVKLHPGVLAGGTEPGEHSSGRLPLATSTATATTSLPPSHDRRLSGPTRRWSSLPLCLLRASRGELAGGDEGHQDGQDEEAHAEHGGGARSRCAELRENTSGPTTPRSCRRPTWR